jgi:hypothetical protein
MLELTYKIITAIYLLGFMGHTLKAINSYFTVFLVSSPSFADHIHFLFEATIYMHGSFLSPLFLPKSKRKYIDAV